MQVNDRAVAVLGAGGSGFAAAALALSQGASVTAYDSGSSERLAPAVERFAEIGVELVTGDEALLPRQQYDYAVLSPGIALDWPIATAFLESSNELIGELELAFRLSKVPVIGITGTNGKTTTTGLIDEMLRGAGLRSIAAGNIGLPYSEVVRSGEEYDFIVIEASSFQLETIVDFSPRVALWTNFAPDHMDRYESLEDYRSAKLRLFGNLSEEAAVIAKFEDKILPGRAFTFSAFSNSAHYGFESGKVIRRSDGESFDFSATALHGRHNAENVMAALAVADALELSWEAASTGILAFNPPAHRCEKVGEIGDVIYLNDSKSTNLHSLESALVGQENPVVLIVGGKEKGLDFSELREVAQKTVRVAICLGEIGPQIADLWSESTRCVIAESLPAAVEAARAEAKAEEVVLFSPGTSSFDMFANYEERGNAFRREVELMAQA